VIDKRLTSVGSSARIHIVEMGKIRNRAFIRDYVGKFSDSLYDKVLAIVPTGWTHQVSVRVCTHCPVKGRVMGKNLFGLIFRYFRYLFQLHIIYKSYRQVLTPIKNSVS
jgi:hypothetical protein